MKTESDICMEISPTFCEWQKSNLVTEISDLNWEDNILAIQKMMANSHAISDFVFTGFVMLPEDIEKISLNSKSYQKEL